MIRKTYTIAFLHVLGVIVCIETTAIYVDTGNPYKDKPLPVGELTLQETVEGSPLHAKAWFPLPEGQYPVIFFIGGLNGYVLAELYSTVLYDISTHGFFVFGVDYEFPAYTEKDDQQVGLDIDRFFKELAWLEHYFQNRTLATPMFNTTGLLCHSSGCNVTHAMLKMNLFNFTANIFLEPFSFDVHHNMTFRMPSLMYGTQLSEEGLPCAIKGFDYKALYNIWKCPKIMMNVADFGHCDILDPFPWQACHTIHFCVTTNNTRLPEYRNFVQGVVSSFFISHLQGRMQDIQYVSDRNKIPLKLLDLQTDVNC